MQEVARPVTFSRVFGTEFDIHSINIEIDRNENPCSSLITIYFDMAFTAICH